MMQLAVCERAQAVAFVVLHGGRVVEAARRYLRHHCGRERDVVLATAFQLHADYGLHRLVVERDSRIATWFLDARLSVLETTVVAAKAALGLPTGTLADLHKFVVERSPETRRFVTMLATGEVAREKPQQTVVLLAVAFGLAAISSHSLLT